MYEFKIGDRVRLIDRDRTLKHGTIMNPLDLYCDPSRHQVPVHFDDYNYEYIEEEDDLEAERSGWDYHGMRPEELELVAHRSPNWEI